MLKNFWQHFRLNRRLQHVTHVINGNLEQNKKGSLSLVFFKNRNSQNVEHNMKHRPTPLLLKTVFCLKYHYHVNK